MKISEKEYQKLYREANKEKAKKYKEDNKEQLKIKAKEYYEKNKEKNKEYNITYSKDYREINKDKIKEEKKIWYVKNKDKVKQQVKTYQKLRKSTDPIFKLKSNIRTMLSNLLKNRGYTKKSNTFNIVGCSYGEFIIYLESKFESWMNWENYGKYNGEFYYGWDIDHIIPISSAKTEEDVIKLNNYTNLQPLCSKINRDIKIDN